MERAPFERKRRVIKGQKRPKIRKSIKTALLFVFSHGNNCFREHKCSAFFGGTKSPPSAGKSISLGREKNFSGQGAKKALPRRQEGE